MDSNSATFSNFENSNL